MMHAGVQRAVGTPQILLAVLFSVVMGYALAGVYVHGVLRVLRAQREQAPVDGPGGPG